MKKINHLIKPQKLHPGDAVGVIAPSGPVNSEELRKGLLVLEKMGFKPLVGKYVHEKNHFIAGTDEQRAKDVMDMFENPDIKAIFCARGGYGVNRILPLLNSKVIRKNPKPLVGSSDITLLLIFLLQKCSMVSFHGPMVAANFGNFQMRHSKKHFQKLLMEPDNVLISWPKAKNLKSGKAEGPLVGGCLTLLCRSLKTPYEIKTEGSILFIEDVNEPDYKIDGMLWHLKTAGKFRNVKGIIFGEMVNCGSKGKGTKKLSSLFQEFFINEKLPILTDCPIGHGSEIWTLPMGSRAELDSDKKIITLTEPALI